LKIKKLPLKKGDVFHQVENEDDIPSAFYVCRNPILMLPPNSENSNPNKISVLVPVSNETKVIDGITISTTKYSKFNVNNNDMSEAYFITENVL